MQRDSRFGFHPNVENLKTSSDEGRARAYCDPFEAFLYEARYLSFFAGSSFVLTLEAPANPSMILETSIFFSFSS